MLEARRPVVQTLGMPENAAWLKQVAEIQYELTRAHDYTLKGLRALERLASAKLPFPEQRLQQLRATLAECVRMQELAWPFSLCPYCKGIAGVQEGCAACLTMGWIPKSLVSGVPDKLWDQVDRVVMVAGEARRITDMLPKLEEPIL